MNGRRAGLSAILLSALAFSIYAVPPAAANTAFKCQFTFGSGAFNDAHCQEGGSGSYFHESIEGAEFAVATNGGTESGTGFAAPAKLRGTAGGVETEIQCKTVSGSGVLSNQSFFGTWVQGVGELAYLSCSVTKPTGKGCAVAGSKVETKELFASSQGLTAQVKIEPAEGTELASVTIEKCSVAGLNHTFPLSGSIIANMSGPTATSTHAAITTQNTLKFAGQKAGLEEAITVEDAAFRGIVLT